MTRVGRPEEPIDPSAGPVQKFAAELRQLRVPGMTYRKLAELTHYSHSVLQAAASGKVWPRWEVVEAFVIACDGDVAAWRERWERTDAARLPAVSSNLDTGTEPEPQSDTAVGPAVEAQAGPQIGLAVAAPADLRPRPAAATVDSPSGGLVVAAPAPQWSRRRSAVLLAVVGVAAVAGALVLSRPAGQPEAVPDIALTTPATRLPTPSPSLPPSPGPTPSPVPSPRPSAAPSTPVPRPSVTSGPTPPGQDPDREVGVQEQRVVELVLLRGYNWVDIEYWRHDAAQPGELQMDAHGVTTALGAKLAVIADSPLAGRARCSHVTAWQDRIEFAALHVGSQLCGRSREGRFAGVEVRVLPDSPSSNGRFAFYGITWN